MSLDSEAPFAEILRHEDLRTEEAASHYSSTIWQAHIDEAMVVDYSTYELAETAGFAVDALVGDDLERCQAEALWLMDRGARGVLSPSAALPGATNLALFGARVGVKWGTTAGLASAIPVQRVTRGHPPAGLTARVRYIGEPEPLLLTYLDSRRGQRGSMRQSER